jgi:hypothetical protein
VTNSFLVLLIKIPALKRVFYILNLNYYEAGTAKFVAEPYVRAAVVLPVQ